MCTRSSILRRKVSWHTEHVKTWQCGGQAGPASGGASACDGGLCPGFHSLLGGVCPRRGPLGWERATRNPPALTLTAANPPRQALPRPSRLGAGAQRPYPQPPPWQRASQGQGLAGPAKQAGQLGEGSSQVALPSNPHPLHTTVPLLQSPGARQANPKCLSGCPFHCWDLCPTSNTRESTRWHPKTLQLS